MVRVRRGMGGWVGVRRGRVGERGRGKWWWDLGEGWEGG